MERLPPIHPGEILLEDFMKPLELSSYRVAKDIGVPALRDQPDRTWTAFDYSRYGNEVGTLLWHECGDMATLTSSI